MAEPRTGITVHVAVCPACQRAFVTTEKFEHFPRHEFPTTGWACTGDLATRWQTFHLLPSSLDVVVAEERAAR